MHPDRRQPRKLRESRGQLAGKLRSDDEMFGRNDIDAVGQRRPCQIYIQQGNDAPDAGDTEPYGQVFRPIGHQQADYFALGNARSSAHRAY